MRPLLWTIAVISVALAPALGLAQSVPTFDVQAYCFQVSEDVGGSYSVMENCTQKENAALAAVRTRQIDPRIADRCIDVAMQIGGGYSIFSGCVDKEETSKRILGSR